MKHRLLAARAAGLVLLAAPSLTPAADAYPSRPVRMITGSVGSTSDLSARFVAQKLSERWKQQVVVDNRPGAGGIIGNEMCAKAAPDGYTLCIGHIGTHAAAPMLFKNLPYDPVRDFEPISLVSMAAIVLVVHPSITQTTLKEFVAHTQARAGTVNYSSPGGATSGNLVGELFNSATGAKLTHIPYKGAGYALTAVVAGETQASFLSTATAAGQVKAGRLRALAVMSQKRFAAAPDIPSLADAGYPGIDANVWFGLFAPARTPKPLVASINREVVSILGLRDVKDALIAQAAEAMPMAPAEYAAFLRAETDKWTRVIRQANIRGD